MTNWEPLSVPATFDVVGSEVPKNRRTIAFAVQSIQKRLPKVIGPLIGGAVFAAIGYWLNLTLAFGFVGVAIVLQVTLMSRMRPKAVAARVPFRAILRDMPRELRRLLPRKSLPRRLAAPTAVLTLSLLTGPLGWSRGAAGTAGVLAGGDGLTALAHACLSQVGRSIVAAAVRHPRVPAVRPVSDLPFAAPESIDLAGSSRDDGPAIPSSPTASADRAGGRRDFDRLPKVRARAVGLYWGLRSFAFCPAPLVAAFLWQRIGPDATFLIGGGIGLVGTAWYVVSNRTLTRR
jgi:hypothetical protein